ncbi:alpha-1,2-Mannosidase [Mycena indigotica]|uniref:alpha-1,2-Mannosidase n=1 Tax=Mycena indigotica TaxID=2126181 RepID=A0A8H6S9G0_9AGAR|nr:alpha-1,2-Mannosidase [Mycena indigotica]KAF7295445.1 alpha-1,2-Mannosidase [Mycena indigotica]
MRRRTSLQLIGLLCVVGIAAHLYFTPASRYRSPADFEEPGFGSGEIVEEEERESTIPRLPADKPKRDAVVAAFKHAWSAYARDAMGADEYHPISHRGTNLSRSGGIGYTVVDALDTMLLMRLDKEYTQASEWVRNSLTFDRDGRDRCFNTFETTIRVLGGLLSAYHLSSDKMYLNYATDLADRLLPSFNTPSGLPHSSTNLQLRVGIPDGSVSTAEATTLQLEFRYLAEQTGNKEYWYKVEKVMQVVDKAKLPNNLVPISMNSNDGSFTPSEIRLGSRGDSYYEYLLKQYLQTARTEPVYLRMYQDAMAGIHKELIRQTPKRKVWYTAELIPGGGGGDWRTSWSLQHKQDHLVCFLGGSLMLGATTVHLAEHHRQAKRAPALSRSPHSGPSRPPHMSELSEIGKRDWNAGVKLLDGCMETHKTATGMSPEIAMFLPDPGQPEREWHIKGSKPGGPASYDARYMLRPETTESLFLAWRLTGDPKYRDHAWGIFQAIEQHAKLPGGGYATVLDVDTVPARLDDKQETFFLSETLKYLYLTFADESVLPLEDYVFNTEAHPLPVFKPTIKPRFTL